MAEIFLSPIIEVLFEKVVSGLFSKLAKLGGIHESQLQKWKKTLSIIRAVLTDAEDKQIEDRSVQMWLHDLQDLAYDLDDIIDELITEYSRHELKMKTQSATATDTASTSSSNKVWRLIPSCCTSFTPTAIKFNYNMGSKLDDITDRLQKLVNQKQDLGLKENVSGIRSYGTRETSHLVDEHVYGRQKEKEEILELLFKDEEQVCVIPIVGMAGLGKTTLAQLVYSDDQVETRFDLKAWVCVSDEFDEFMITRKIFEWVSKETRNFESLSMVQQSLMEKLSNKKFLLVLDDVWNENYGKWDLLRTPFRAGAPGSKIIVTTRNEGVASTMRSPSIPTYHLTQLTKDDCVSILAQHALGTRDFEAHPNLKVVGENIARKCNGSPLAAKTLGGLLRTDASANAWENVLKSKFWELPAEKSGILPALRLSYHHLPPHLKRLFTYCSIFPKDYQFDKFELVLLWIAEGFLRQAEEKKQMEERGFQYFNELLSRSFFQHSSGDQSQFVMHDLMNDLAQFVAGQVCFRLDDKMINNEQETIYEKARHSSSIRFRYGTFNKFEAFYKARSLRTFLTLPLHDWGQYHLSNKVVHELLQKLRCLRVLNLSGYYITELPNSIGDLRHLRYLNLSKTLIKQLPESVSDLYNLETLLLRSCSQLIKLPAKMGNLINLRHLDVSNTTKLQEMPSGIGTLTSLQTLSKIVLDESNMLQLTELRGLSNLIGTFSIMGLQHVKNVQDARQANLLCKQGLKELMLIWSSEFNDSRSELLENEVLEALKPHTSLTNLEIEFYGGLEFSSWVGDPSFSNITNLALEHCEKCTSLPPVGQLPSLKQLCVSKMSGVKTVGVELYGNRHAQALSFPSLEILRFEHMKCWEEWITCLTDVDGSVGGLYPRLRELTLRNCPKLVKVILPRIPSLRVLDIQECCEVVLSSMVSVSVASSVETLKIRDITGLINLCSGVVQSLASLEDLTINNCDELSYLWQEESLCQNLVNLKCLCVLGCRQLVSLAKEEHAWPPSIEQLIISMCDKLEKLPNWVNNLTSLRRLIIENCSGLQFCPTMTDLQSNSSSHVESFPHLEYLAIGGCFSLTCLPTGQNLPTALKSLRVGDCPNLEPDSENFWVHSRCIPALWVNLKVLPGCLFSFNRLTELKIRSCLGIESFGERGLPPSLRKLEISNCENLKSLAERGLPPSLRKLSISNCENLKSLAERGLPPSLRKLEISDCENLKSLAERGLPPSLRELSISYCENLKSLPDVQMQSLTSLEILAIRYCRSFVSSPVGVWPPNLRELTVQESPPLFSNYRTSLSEWGLQRLPTSLVSFTIEGYFPEVVCFPDTRSLFPTSLTTLKIVRLESLSMDLQNLTSLQNLYIHSCPKLQSLSMGLQNLTSLQVLDISSCPKLQSLPEKLLPTLSSLMIFRCPLLEERCLKEKGCYWPLIADIPDVVISKGVW